jgi:hypothetical protein
MVNDNIVLDLLGTSNEILYLDYIEGLVGIPFDEQDVKDGTKIPIKEVRIITKKFFDKKILLDDKGDESFMVINENSKILKKYQALSNEIVRMHHGTVQYNKSKAENVSKV